MMKAGDNMGCMKCGRKLGSSQTFCDDCLEEMKLHPVKPNTVVKLPSRPAPSSGKKRPQRRLYFWNAESTIDALRSRVRWLTFALVVISLCLLAAIAVVLFFLYRQGQLDLGPLRLPAV